jgi:hypothetical protein
VTNAQRTNTFACNVQEQISRASQHTTSASDDEYAADLEGATAAEMVAYETRESSTNGHKQDVDRRL